MRRSALLVVPVVLALGCYEADAPVLGLDPLVATIVVSPPSRTLSTDSVRSYGSFTAVVRDAVGNELVNRVVNWTSSDSTVVRVLLVSDAQVFVRGLRAGDAVLYATSEGKTAQASVSVTP